MANEKPTTPSAQQGPGDKPRRRRSPPTIDLSASEVPTPDISAPNQAEGAGEGSARESWSAAPDETPKRSHFAITSSHAIAGLAGGALVALVLSALWLSGLAPIRYAGSTAISARVTGLEMQVKSIAQDLANKPAADMGALDQIKERVGKVEQSLAKIPSGDPAAAERATAAENSMKSLGIALAALTRRADEIAGNATATRDEVATLQKRMDALEVAVKTTQEKVAASSNADNAARLALAAAALRDAVARGEPYTSQLAAIRSLGADAKPLAALEPFAASGIPTDAALSRELAALLPAMRDVAGPDTVAPAGFLDRLQANASKLVRVRPTGAPAGDDPSAILARLEVKIARNDVSGAQADIAKLPLKSRTLAEAWSRKADARKKTLTAAAAISAEAARSLGHPPKLP